MASTEKTPVDTLKSSSTWCPSPSRTRAERIGRAGHKKTSPVAEVRSREAGISVAPQPRRSIHTRYGGRSPDLRIILLAEAFPADIPPVARPIGFRPRSQWRVREGIAPSSRDLYQHSYRLIYRPGTTILRHGCQTDFLRRGCHVTAVTPCIRLLPKTVMCYVEKYSKRLICNTEGRHCAQLPR